MSTEHQRYSIEYQSVENAAFALQRGYSVVRTYVDSGISGLTLTKRDGLKSLLADVVGGRADYDVVLVYDVSRWGRFQDADEAAHYEFVCREAGVAVEYTAEPFENDGSLVTGLVKHLKRAMAAEYSRELSAKISRAQRGLGAKGYWQGGPCGLGLRRASLNPDGSLRGQLETGERNGIAGNRVTLVPGPPAEVALVREIFRLASEGATGRGIAEELNGAGVFSPRGKRWDQATILNILRNEKYVGVNIVGRTLSKVGRRTRQPREAWIKAKDAFEPLIAQDIFDEAQRTRRWRSPPATDDQLIDALRAVLADRGRLSFEVIRKDPRTPYPTTYVARFGSLGAVYKLVGYDPRPRQQMAMASARLHRPHLRRGRGNRDSALAAEPRSTGVHF